MEMRQLATLTAVLAVFSGSAFAADLPLPKKSYSYEAPKAAPKARERLTYQPQIQPAPPPVEEEAPAVPEPALPMAPACPCNQMGTYPTAGLPALPQAMPMFAGALSPLGIPVVGFGGFRGGFGHFGFRGHR